MGADSTGHIEHAQPRAVRGQKRTTNHARVTPAAKRHSSTQTRRHSPLGLAAVKLEPADDDDAPGTATSALQRALPLGDRQRLAAMVGPGFSLEYGFHICDADAGTSTSGGAVSAALSWVVGSVVKPTSRVSKAGGWWLVHFADGDRLEVQTAASNYGTAWRPQGQPSLAESSQALAAADLTSWQMLATSSALVNAAKPQPAGAMGHEQLATSVFTPTE